MDEEESLKKKKERVMILTGSGNGKTLTAEKSKKIMVAALVAVMVNWDCRGVKNSGPMRGKASQGPSHSPDKTHIREGSRSEFVPTGRDHELNGRQTDRPGNTHAMMCSAVVCITNSP